MKRILAWTGLALILGIAGCQSAKTEYGFRCTYRAMDGGLCDKLNAPAPDPIKEPGVS
jgi:hypothetical protein